MISTSPAFIAAAVVFASFTDSKRKWFYIAFGVHIAIAMWLRYEVEDIERSARILIKTLPTMLFLVAVVYFRLLSTSSMWVLYIICYAFSVYYFLLAAVPIESGPLIEYHQGIIIGINAAIMGCGADGLLMRITGHAKHSNSDNDLPRIR